MVKYRDFNSTPNKVRTIWEQTQENISDLKDLNIKQIIVRSVSFNKIISIEPIITEVLIDPALQTIKFQIQLVNLSDNAIRSMRVLALFSTEDGFVDTPEYVQQSIGVPGTGSNLNNGLQYVLIKKDTNTYNLNLDVHLFASNAGEIIPMSVEVNIYFLNRHIFENI